MSQNNQSVEAIENAPEQCDFLIEEYKTLREEIKETKARIFQLAGAGVIGIPSSYFLAENYEKLKLLRMSLPILLCTVMLFFLAETRALMRCGQYIKDHIETLLKERNARYIGWEHWLETSDNINQPLLNKRRVVDILVTVFFDLLFIFYYVVSVNLALETYGAGIWRDYILGGYYALGGFVTLFLIINFKESTSTKK